MWHVKNNRLYSGTDTTDTSNPVFIVGTSFNFGGGPSIPSAWIDDAAKINRTNAGNAVYMYGPYLGSGDDDGSAAGQRVINRMHENNNINYFAVTMQMWEGTNSPFWRGSHTPVFNGTQWAESGHWKKVPISSYLDNSTNTDDDYISTYGNDSSYWDPTNEHGTPIWHTNWLSAIRNCTASDLNTKYHKLFNWYLVDEPFNSNWYRDYLSNEKSVSGHSAFCYTAENSGTPDVRPKMVDIKPSAETAWSRLSNQIDILCGNEYGYYLANPEWNQPWRNVNMAKWCWSKVSGNTNKMVMAWLPGFANSNATSGNIHMKYMFYGSIIEGARGILWYMTDDAAVNPYSDYTGYTNLSGIYSGFTTGVTFKSDGGTKTNHMEFLLKGEKVASILMSPTITNGYTYDGTYGDSLLLTSQISHLAWKYSNRWRVFVANNMTNAVTFNLKIDDSALDGLGYSNAYDLAHVSNKMNDDGGRYVLTGDLSAYGYNIYDIGLGNQ